MLAEIERGSAIALMDDLSIVRQMYDEEERRSFKRNPFGTKGCG